MAITRWSKSQLCRLEVSLTLKKNNQMENRASRGSNSFFVRAEDKAVIVKDYTAAFDKDTVIDGQRMERITTNAFKNAVGRDYVIS